MAVNPELERAFDLLVHKQSILFEIGVSGYPTERPEAHYYSCADFESSGARNVHRWKGRAEQCKSVIALVEREYPSYRRVDDNALAEGGQSLFL